MIPTKFLELSFHGGLGQATETGLMEFSDVPCVGTYDERVPVPPER